MILNFDEIKQKKQQQAKEQQEQQEKDKTVISSNDINLRIFL